MTGVADPSEVAPPPAAADGVRVQQLARVSAELGAAHTMPAVIAAAVRHAAHAIGAAVNTLMVVEDDRLVLVGGYGLQPGVDIRWRCFDLADTNPASEAARTGQPIAVGSVDEIEARYSGLRGQVPAGRSLLCLPLGAGEPAVGVLGLTFDGGWLPNRTDLHLLTTFAQTCGQAIRRVQVAEQATQRSDQLAFLAEASAELSRSLDYRVTLSNVADLAVPMLADWCAVDIVQDDGTATTLAVAHVDPAKVAWAWELQERYPADPSAPTGTPNVIRTGRSELYPAITDEMIVAGARDEEHLRLIRELRMRSVLVVPLTARGRSLGAITLIRAETDRRFGPSDLTVAEDLGRRAGIAIDNARLFSETQDVARQLRRAVLPDTLDTIAGWEIAAHSTPGGRAEVGGDFYDAVLLPGGALAFTIGDVMGHGVPAAAAMAQMRAAIRAYLCLDPEPAGVVAKLDTMFEGLAIAELVTLVYGVVDLAAGRIGFVNAGHYPPLLISPGCAPQFLQLTPARPLGAGGAERIPVTADFGPQDTVLLYTDGLIERRDENVDVGMSRLLGAATLLRGPRLETALEQLVGRLAHDGDHDDVTAMALRPRPSV